MLNFATWCSTKKDKQGAHDVVVLAGIDGKRQIGIDHCAAAIPGHYGNPAFAAKLLAKLGRKKAAGHLENQLPTSKQLRSGDLGEIIATHYVAESTGYTHFIKRLRFKDHRNMAMRGDDFIGIKDPAKLSPLQFLKAEVKSRVAISSFVLGKARKALRADSNRPSPHALAFVAERLSEQGQDDLAVRIAAAQLERIELKNVEHMLFVFSENDPLTLLKKNLADYTGTVGQVTVGLFVAAHQKFIKAVFDKVIANGKKP